MTRFVASPSKTALRASPWPIGSVVPDSTVCSATTSMAIPFSACIMISPPLSAVRCIARKMAPSSL